MNEPAPFGQVERTLAWRYLRATRANGGVSLVSIISFIGIMLAVTALIVIMSIMSGFRTTLLDALLSGDGHVTVSVGSVTEAETERYIDLISNLPEVEGAFPRMQRFVLAENEYASSPALLRGVRMQDLDKLSYLERDLPLIQTTDFGQGRLGGDKIFLGRFLAIKLRAGPGTRLKVTTTSTNSTIGGRTPRNKTYTVAGIISSGSVELDEALILMPMEQAQVLFSSKESYDDIDVRLFDFMSVEEPQDKIEALGDRRFYVDNWQNQRAAYFNALNVEAGMMRLIMLILITITALNIITGVVMLVKNKTRDIAILRTIGATRGSMMRVFLMVGAMLGLTGALIGLGIGSLIVLNIGSVEAGINVMLNWFGAGPLFPPSVYGLDGLPAEFSLIEAAFVTLWAMAMSILVTLWPAWSAAKLDPVDALRFE